MERHGPDEVVQEERSEGQPDTPRGGESPKRMRQPKRYWPMLLVIAVIAVAAWLIWKRCSGGFGAQGGRSQPGESMAAEPRTPGSTSGRGEDRCQLRVDAKGISHEGKPIDHAAALKICAQAKIAQLTITGDARHGTVEDLEAALRAAGATPVRAQPADREP